MAFYSIHINIIVTLKILCTAKTNLCSDVGTKVLSTAGCNVFVTHTEFDHLKSESINC